MKTPEELNIIKAEMETLNKKLAELSEEELAQVSGGKYPAGIISTLAALSTYQLSLTIGQ